jgi:hypothetical protein
MPEKSAAYDFTSATFNDSINGLISHKRRGAAPPARPPTPQQLEE